MGLEGLIRNLVDVFPGTVGLVINDMVGGRSLCINEAERLPAASLIKLPILWECFAQQADGRVSRETRISLTNSRKAGGSGILQFLEPGVFLTFQDLATLMITVSDNMATNLLIDSLGQDCINSAIRGLGLGNTILQRPMMDFDSARQGVENVTTAADIAQLLAHFVRSDTLPAAARAHMIRILAQQQLNDRLSADWPEAIAFAHKTGSLPGIEHDVGILYPETRPLIIVLLTRTDPFSRAGVRLCREVGQLLYQEML